MSPLRSPIFENSHFLAEIKHVLDQTSNAFNTKFGTQWKDWESSYQGKQILSFRCKIVTLIWD